MKPTLRLLFGGCIVATAILTARPAGAADYSIDWYTIDGGGGTSTGGVYSLSGTIGQPDAGVMSGGNYTVVGGFWSVVQAIQTAGAPFLTVAYTTTNTVVVSWPSNSAGWVLQYSPSISPGSILWTDIAPPYPVSGTNNVRIDLSPTGNRFYRLHQ